MPELPEVETVRRGLAADIAERPIEQAEARRADLRRPFPTDLAARLVGRHIADYGRRGKYLLLRLDNDDTLIAHLGMSGRMTISHGNRPPLGRHDHFVMDFAGGLRLVFTDPRRFGVIDMAAAGALEAHPLLARMGPEPLSSDFDGVALAAALKGRKTPIKSALLDQRVVAGVGNIYACEALFRARLSPRRSAHTVQAGRADRLAKAVRAVLEDAIEAGGSSLRDYANTDGELGYFQHRFSVYDREGERCPGCDCDRAVVRLVQSGRSTFYCPTRQR